MEQQNPYLAILKMAQMRAQRDGTLNTIESLKDYGLDNFDCPVCGNTGYERYQKNGYEYARQCECMKRRKNIRNMERSGLMDIAEVYTFENYKANDEATKHIKSKAIEFCKNESGWFYLAGKTGSGKTHICTAITITLGLDHGKQFMYVKWRDLVDSLKIIKLDEEYKQRMDKMKKVDVLYIDDLFKGKTTEADVNIAYDLINERYNDRKKRTIISSELMIPQVLDIDEAIGGRIMERSRGYTLKAPEKNWRIS